MIKFLQGNRLYLEHFPKPNAHKKDLIVNPRIMVEVINSQIIAAWLLDDEKSGFRHWRSE